MFLNQFLKMMLNRFSVDALIAFTAFELFCFKTLFLFLQSCYLYTCKSKLKDSYQKFYKKISSENMSKKVNNFSHLCTCG